MPDSASIIPKLSEILTTFTDEAKAIALSKCSELGFDVNRAQIPIEESFINLQSATQILRDAIHRKKLIQIPLSFQRHLLEAVEAVSNSLAGFTAGRDEVETFTNSVERVNAEIWQSRLMDLSPEVLGFQTKLNQLKQQEVETTQLNSLLREGLGTKAKLESIVNRANESESAAAAHAKKIAEYKTETETRLGEVKVIADAANAIQASVKQNDESVSTQLSAAKASAIAISSIEENIKAFFGEINNYRKQLDDAKNAADTSVDNNNEKTSVLITRLSSLEDGIKKQIEKATGFTLFHSFQTRQEQIKSSKNFWTYTLGVLVAVSIGLTTWLILSKPSLDVALYLKLSISIPLIYAISFCTVQYSRERKLEEEYAFKSAISISLDPYQELVSRIMKTVTDPVQANLEQAKFTAFIIESINKVFMSPTDKVFESPEKEQPLTDKAFEKTLKLAGAVAEIAKTAKPVG